jgi:hypothetical protein
VLFGRQLGSPVTQGLPASGLARAKSRTRSSSASSGFFAAARPSTSSCGPFAGPALAARLAERGYRPIEHSNVLVRPLAADGEPAGSPAIVVRPIRFGEEGLWAEISARGWSFGRASGNG